MLPINSEGDVKQKSTLVSDNVMDFWKKVTEKDDF